MTGQAPGEHTTSTMGELFMAAGPSLRTDEAHRELAIEVASGLIWQEGCGDFVPATPDPAATPVPSGEPQPAPGPSVARLSVFLDLAGWDDDHAAWEASNVAWINAFRGQGVEHSAFAVGGARCAPGADRGVHTGPEPDLDPDSAADSTPEPTPTPEPTATPEPTPALSAPPPP